MFNSVFIFYRSKKRKKRATSYMILSLKQIYKILKNKQKVLKLIKKIKKKNKNKRNSVSQKKETPSLLLAPINGKTR